MIITYLTAWKISNVALGHKMIGYSLTGYNTKNSFDNGIKANLTFLYGINLDQDVYTGYFQEVI